MNKFGHLAILLLAVIGFANGLCAHPDVFFKDSDAHGGAYLEHIFNPQNPQEVSFILSAPIEDFKLDSTYFNRNDLVSYINNVYHFTDPNLKEDMLKQMEESFESKFAALVFLSELQKVLNDYRAWKRGAL
jgi:hypothetical protein